MSLNFSLSGEAQSQTLSNCDPDLAPVLEALDVIFHVLHILMIIINLTFWMSFRTLRIAQVSVLLTLGSWFGFGYFYGFGYCFLTDWHWQIKERLGQSNLPFSYIKYALDNATGTNWDAVLVDNLAFAGLAFTFTGCLIQTMRYRKIFGTYKSK
jgi:hypothetical protein